MNNNCNIADKRPKRRKDKNNPYTIYSVGIETDHPRYFVEFDDSEGTHQCIEIDEKNFKLFDQFELEDLSYLNEINRHYGELDNKELSTEDDTTWQTVLSRLDHERLHSFIDQLPEIQKRRLQLYYFEN